MANLNAAAYVAAVAPHASIFKGWAPHAKERAYRRGLHQAINLAARDRRQIAGLEGRPLCFDQAQSLRNWALSMAQIRLYRAEIARLQKEA